MTRLINKAWTESVRFKQQRQVDMMIIKMILQFFVCRVVEREMNTFAHLMA